MERLDKLKQVYMSAKSTEDRHSSESYRERCRLEGITDKAKRAYMAELAKTQASRPQIEGVDPVLPVPAEQCECGEDVIVGHVTYKGKRFCNFCCSEEDYRDPWTCKKCGVMLPKKHVFDEGFGSLPSLCPQCNSKESD